MVLKVGGEETIFHSIQVLLSYTLPGLQDILFQMEKTTRGKRTLAPKKGLLSALFVAKTRVGEFLPIPSILFALPFPPSFLASLTKKIFPEKGKREREKEGEATELEAGTIFERRLTFGLPLSPSFLTRQKVFSPPPHWTPVSWDQHMISEGGRRPDVVCGCDFGR